MVLIRTAQELSDIRNDLAGAYELANDIDCTFFGAFVPIASILEPFTGTLNGKGFKIIGLSVSGAGSVGLFSAIDHATVENLEFKDCTASSSKNYIGLVAGTSTFSTISKIKVTGGTVSSTGYSGSIIGNCGDTNISNCYTFGRTTASRGHAGGLVGLVTRGTISKSFANNNGSADARYGSYKMIAGGNGASSVITETYFNTLNGTDVVGKGLTDAQSKLQSSFVGFSEEDWLFVAGAYPELIFTAPALPSKNETIETVSTIENLNQSISIFKNATVKTLTLDSHIDSFSHASVTTTKGTRILTSSTDPFETSVTVVFKELNVYASAFVIENATESSVI